jgi:hypothetical protein
MVESLVFFLIFSVGLVSQEVSGDLERFLKSGKDTQKFSVVALEPFSKTPYLFQRNVSHLQTLQYTGLIPTHPDYGIESKSFSEILDEGDKESLMIQTTLENPLRERILLEPQEPKLIDTGYPFRVSVWVHSNFYKGTLYLQFKNSMQGTFKVKVGSLDFLGWQRLEVSFPFVKKIRESDPRKKKFSMVGIGMEFSKQQPQGPIVVYLDRILVLLEKYEEYPGSDVQDGWRFK